MSAVVHYLPEPPSYFNEESQILADMDGLTDYAPFTHDPELGPAQEEQEPDVDLLEKFKVYSPACITDWKPRDEVIQGFISQKDVNILYGASNTGKTFIALEMAACVAGGYGFFNRQVESGLVVYVASESPSSVEMRAMALSRYKKYNLKDLFIVSKPIDLFDSNDAIEVAAIVMGLEAQTGRKAQLIIIDTLARVSGGADENGSDMKMIMNECDKMRDNTGCAILIIHHTGKDASRGERGWSGIRAHIDNSLELLENGGIVMLKATKARDHAKGETDIAFKLAPVSMGRNNMGEVTTAVCEAVDVAEAKAMLEAEQKAKKKLSKHHKGLNDAFHRAAREKGELNEDGTLKGVSRADLMDAFGEYFLTEAKGKPESIRTTFDRELAKAEELTQDKNQFVSVKIEAGGNITDIIRNDWVKDIVKHIKARVSDSNDCKTQNTNTDTN